MEHVERFNSEERKQSLTSSATRSWEGRSDRRTSYDATANLNFIRCHGRHTTLNRTYLNCKNGMLTNLSSLHMGSYELIEVAQSRACIDIRHLQVLQSLRHAVSHNYFTGWIDKLSQIVRERHRRTIRVTNAPVVYPAVRYYDTRLKLPQARSTT